MDSGSMIFLFDLIILVYGLYIVYSACRMRKTHQPPSLLINRTELVGARDVEGFCEAMFAPFVVFGIVAVVYGVAGLINDFFMEIAWLFGASVLVFLAFCFWFVWVMRKNKSKFL